MGGFTLIELSVTIVIIGAALLLALPKLSIFEEIAFRSDIRRVAGFIKRVDDSASSGKSWYRLTFNIGGNSIEASRSTDGALFTEPAGIPARVRLGRGTEITKLMQNGAALDSGEAGILFYPGAGAEAFSILLKRDGQTRTVTYNPYSGNVKVI